MFEEFIDFLETNVYECLRKGKTRHPEMWVKSGQHFTLTFLRVFESWKEAQNIRKFSRKGF